MNIALLILSGALMGVAQFFFGRLSSSLPAGISPGPILHAALTGSPAYLYLLFNVAALALYLVTLRHVPLTQGYVTFAATQGAVVLLLDLTANRAHLTTLNLAGAALGVVAILLMSTR